MKRTKYSDAFKENALRRLAAPGQTARALAAELGIHETLLYRWRRKAGTPSRVTKHRSPRISATRPITATASAPSEPRPQRRPQDWTHDEKIAAVLESMSLTEEQLGGFLRQRGLYRATLDEWRESVLRGARAELGGRPTKSEKRARAADAKRIRTLERELVRKDKALAEAAALLVLKKKVSALLGDEDDDTEPMSGR
jgi:transposase-like protein